MRRWFWFLAAPAAATVASAAALKYLAVPFLWVCGCWMVVCGAMAWRARAGWRTAGWVNAAALLAFVAVAELVAARHVIRDERNSAKHPSWYFEKNDVLGTAPRRASVARVRAQHDDTISYDVVYTIGSNGLRRAPPDRGATVKRCVLFFGDSFMFGEGVNDEETIPYRVGVIAQGEVRGFNLAFHGYGAQQMLSALERGRVDSLLTCRPTHAIYDFLFDHVARAAGLRSWGRHSPRYELTPDGKDVRYAGHFDDEDAKRPPPPFIVDKIQSQFAKSYLYRWIWSRPKQPQDGDVRRYLAIVNAAARLIAQKYPGCQFDVLVYESSSPPLIRMTQKVHDGLVGAGLRVHLVKHILPQYAERRAMYQLPFDGHPNALADDLVATYIVRSVLELPAPTVIAGTR